ncbi:hypothetical protein [Sporolactobacillus spathodeae]|uniref:Uncharacterized protein n=1 Tax=Sporolactobacillus spathodeae TaxID=1465502 RepID=A0ABS2Q819_9BACL|nr:hypothetical protein [Sporolactobacillus spathodeae]MBM7657922.1 hypothetical protein [Sporolactobacillus spathodeae]
MPRRIKAYHSCLGIAQLYDRNPFVVAWWSAAFPGFGHMLLNMHLRGNLFFLFEILINVNAKLNLAMVYTFCGKFESAKNVIDTRWILLYIPFYFFCIWDSYRSAIDMNKLNDLAKDEKLTVQAMVIKNCDICFLDKRNPLIAAIYSLFMPGLGQIYTKRTIPAIALLIWTLVISYFSKDLEAVERLVSGDIIGATRIVDGEWLLFFPSLIFGASYDALASTVEQNHIFTLEQKQYLWNEWQPAHFYINLPIRKEE